jgi:microcystin-dependent protein
MTTPNIVPRGNGEGGIGTNEKFWKNGYFENLQTRGGAVATESHVQLSVKNHNDDIDAHSAAIGKHNSATPVHTANLASKDEAEAGINTSKFMTPARVSDAIKNFAGADLTGMIFAFAGNTLPDGYLSCDGSQVSRTTYKELFDVIGTTYGEGDGSATFNLPNLTDKFIQGSNTVGTVKNAGLPNITGTLSTYNGAILSLFNNLKGCFTQDNPKDSSLMYDALPENTSQYAADYCGGGIFDASRSNNIYGNATTVQPPAVTMHYIIKY